MLKQLTSIAGEELGYQFYYFRYLIFNKQHPKRSILVNGSPKTGTTWMLKMMISLPGYQRTAGYNFRGDIRRYHEVLPGDVVHGHDLYTPELREILLSNKIKVILMVRDPRDQVVSRMFHLKRDTTQAWHQTMNKMNDDEALMACIEGLPKFPGIINKLKLTQSWLDAGDLAICIRYEDLLSDTVGELQKVLQYLKITVNKSLVQAIVNRNRFERLTIGRQIWKPSRQPGQQDAASHFRKGIVGDWKNHFKETHIQRFKELAGETLIEWGYEKNFDW